MIKLIKKLKLKVKLKKLKIIHIKKMSILLNQIKNK